MVPKIEALKNNVLSSLRPMDKNPRQHEQDFRIASNHMLQNLVVVLMERPMQKVQAWRVVRIVQQVNLGAVLTNLLMQLELMV